MTDDRLGRGWEDVLRRQKALAADLPIVLDPRLEDNVTLVIPADRAEEVRRRLLDVGCQTSQEIDEQGQVLQDGGITIVSTPKTERIFMQEVWASTEPRPLTPWNIAILSHQRMTNQLERWLAEQFKYHGRQPEDYELRVYEGYPPDGPQQEYVLLLHGRELSRLVISLRTEHKED